MDGCVSNRRRDGAEVLDGFSRVSNLSQSFRASRIPARDRENPGY